MKLEVGKTYRLNNGKVHECTEMFGRDPLHVSESGFGPFVIDGFRYHQDGTFGVGGSERYDVECEVSGELPKKWEDLTRAEKGELLLARHEGADIQTSVDGVKWDDDYFVALRPGRYYRVKEHCVKTVVLYGQGHTSAFTTAKLPSDSHSITFDTIDGEPDCSSVKMEKIKQAT